LWVSLTKYHRFPHDLLSMSGLALATFITASVTLRSRFSADRVVFGLITVAFLFTAMRMAPLTSFTMRAVKFGEAFMWTVAATLSLVVSLGGFKTLRKA